MDGLNKINEVTENVKIIRQTLQRYSDANKAIDDAVKKELEEKKKKAETILRQIKF